MEAFLESVNWAVVGGAAAAFLQFALAVAVILRVILTRHPPSAALAWIILTTILPYVGFILYVTIGERPIGRWRQFKLKAAVDRWNAVLAQKRGRREKPPKASATKGSCALRKNWATFR